MTKGEILLQAMECLPDEAILDAEYGAPAKPRRLRRFVTVALAAALLLCMSVTVGAYVGAGDWFKDFFETLDQKLSDGQKQFIDDSAVDIGKSVTQNGYTVTLESLMMDSQRMYVKLVVEGPEGVDLKTSSCNVKTNYYCVIDGEEYSLTAGGSQDEKYEDRMGEANVLTIIDEYFWELPEGVSADPQEIQCGLRVERLWIRSILDPDQDWTVEGLWEFDFDLSLVEPAAELLTEPLTVTMGDIDCPWNIKDVGPSMYGKTWEVDVHSMKLSPMGLTMICTHQKEELQYWSESALRVMLHDGTDVPILTVGGHRGSTVDYEEWYYSISPPLDLDEMAYLEFEDGTKVELPR